MLSPNEALSGAFGSISLAAWIFLLIPQLIENYTKGSADGISLSFLTVWFIGDICNFVGAVWAGLVPTVIALAVYFIFADLVLIIQCLYYNHINSRKKVRQLSTISTQSQPRSDEEPLLGRSSSDNIGLPGSRRRPSVSQSYRNRHGSNARRDSSPKMNDECSASRAWMKNTISVFLVCAAGTGGWFIAWETGVWSPTPKEDGDNGSSMAPGAQTLGYLSAICYLGARIPQILKNYRERSTDGLAILFFVLSLLGNATYGAGILFHSTARGYFITNLPWLIGSLGTMAEDVIIFIQFHAYSRSADAVAVSESE